MESPKPEKTYTMPLDELLELLGATRKTTERPARSARKRPGTPAKTASPTIKSSAPDTPGAPDA